MSSETEGRQTISPWNELASVVNGLSLADRDRFRAIFRTFAHDLRQACGQIQAAERLLRRDSSNEEAGEWLELLGVIQAANAAANSLLASMTIDFLEQIDSEPG